MGEDRERERQEKQGDGERQRARVERERERSYRDLCMCQMASRVPFFASLRNNLSAVEGSVNNCCCAH